MGNVLKVSGIIVLIAGVIATCVLTSQAVEGSGLTTFIAGAVSTYLTSIILLGLGTIIENQYAMDSNTAANISALERKLDRLEKK